MSRLSELESRVAALEALGLAKRIEDAEAFIVAANEADILGKQGRTCEVAAETRHLVMELVKDLDDLLNREFHVRIDTPALRKAMKAGANF
jgi:hypothetical protein